MVSNSFDLWQKDVFFSAAEEVQESTDIMESMYRTWIRNRREFGSKDYSEGLRRELQTTLGTAKWQLEEFEKAVRLNHGSLSEDNTTLRHRQFVDAINDQISRVENSLKESCNEKGNQPLRWVNLDAEERDDLAAFLTGTSGLMHGRKDEHVGNGLSSAISLPVNEEERKNLEIDIRVACKRGMPDSINEVEEFLTSDEDAKYVVRLKAKEVPRTRDDFNYGGERSSGQRRTFSSPNFGALKIVIGDEDEQRKKLVERDEPTPKEKSKEHHFPSNGVILSYHGPRGINCFNQLFGRVGGFQRQLRSSRQMQNGCSLQLTLVFMLTIFLIVPFLLYTT